jgi:hypothetical protein
MDLEKLVIDHFEKASEIKQLDEEKKEIDKEIFDKIIETKAFDFVSINWRNLHRFAFGHPKSKRKR